MGYMFVPGKVEYCCGNRPKVDCILCAIRDKSPEVISLEVYRNELFIISLNLYPYNPGHLLIFPQRHIEDLRDYSDKEVIQLQQLLVKSMIGLEKIYGCGGFNTGYNIGQASGASISHLHLHLVPRFNNELGFVDIIAGEKIFVEDPRMSLQKIREVLNDSD